MLINNQVSKKIILKYEKSRCKSVKTSCLWMFLKYFISIVKYIRVSYVLYGKISCGIRYYLELNRYVKLVWVLDQTHLMLSYYVILLSYVWLCAWPTSKFLPNNELILWNNSLITSIQLLGNNDSRSFVVIFVKHSLIYITYIKLQSGQSCVFGRWKLFPW